MNRSFEEIAVRAKLSKPKLQSKKTKSDRASLVDFRPEVDSVQTLWTVSRKYCIMESHAYTRKTINARS